MINDEAILSYIVTRACTVVAAAAAAANLKPRRNRARKKKNRIFCGESIYTFTCVLHYNVLCEKYDNIMASARRDVFCGVTHKLKFLVAQSVSLATFSPTAIVQTDLININPRKIFI